jgi:hypothetical protein
MAPLSSLPPLIMPRKPKLTFPGLPESIKAEGKTWKLGGWYGSPERLCALWYVRKQDRCPLVVMYGDNLADGLAKMQHFLFQNGHLLNTPTPPC